MKVKGLYDRALPFQSKLEKVYLAWTVGFVLPIRSFVGAYKSLVRVDMHAYVETQNVFGCCAP